MPPSVAPCVIRIVERPIAIQGVYDLLADHGSGAVVVFVGRVREANAGSPVRSIVYEAYASMAVAECQRIWAEACRRWECRSGVIVHRIGELAVGAVSVAIGVATAHREAAFAAAQFVIDQLKAQVPIWKKEIYAEGAQWATPTPAS